MKITRFAPSPTGSMHIGNLRTLLYNFLYTKNDKIILRIEDTDFERSTKENTDRIFDIVDTFKFTFAETYYQSKNINRHKEVVEYLLESGFAYKCYCTPEELENQRAQARIEKRPPIYQNTWRDNTEELDLPYSVRIKTRLEGTYVFDDMICGKVEVPANTVDDFIIMRSDGTPTYMLAVVIDDNDEGVNTIIRGADHRTNTVRQMAVYEAMGWEIPAYAHCPLITDSSNAKLSKRSGDASVETHLKNGIYPDALLNYILKLGFSFGPDNMTIEDMKNVFDVTKVNKASAKFDHKKMISTNKLYMQNFDFAYFVEFAKKYHDTVIDVESTYGERIKEIGPLISKRESTYLDILNSVFYLADNDVFFERERTLNPDVSVISEIHKDLNSKWGENDQATDLDKILTDIVERLSVKKMVVYKNLRMAICDLEHSPSLPDIMISLGKNIIIDRLEKLL